MELMRASAFEAAAAMESSREDSDTTSWAVAVIVLLNHESGLGAARCAEMVPRHHQNSAVFGRITGHSGLHAAHSSYCRHCGSPCVRAERTGDAVSPSADPRPDSGIPADVCFTAHLHACWSARKRMPGAVPAVVRNAFAEDCAGCGVNSGAAIAGVFSAGISAGAAGRHGRTLVANAGGTSAALCRRNVALDLASG